MQSCFVQGCTTKRKKNVKKGEKGLSFFKPTNDEVLRSWQKVIPSGHLLRKHHSICELHFKEEDVEKDFVHHEMPDGSTYRLQKQRPSLKIGSKPCKFPDKNIENTENNRVNVYYTECVAPPNTFYRSVSIVEEIEKQSDKSIMKPSSEGNSVPINECFEKRDLTICGESNNFIQICVSLTQNPQSIVMPSTWIPQVISTGVKCIMWCEWKPGYSGISKRIVLFPDMTVHIYIEESLVHLDYREEIQSCNDITQLISYVSSNIFPCDKIDGLRKLKKRNKISLIKVKKVNEKMKRLKRKIDLLKKRVEEIKTECSKADSKAIENACSQLPKSQQAAVTACFNASKQKDSRGNRYTNEWIYECLLLRIKSRKTYNHLRTHKILVLPCLETLSRYIKVIKGTYGFDEKTFDILRKKTANMNATDVRGILLVDEMKLTKTLTFDRQKLKMEGFTTLGNYTPKNQQGQKGDHALVIMFQPFKGKWVQSLGCFLSRGSANGTVLHQILVEAIILAERAGLKVDGIANDGASWNRAMWDHFGVTEKNVSVEHIVDPTRRLWFFSYFPHLIKCLRNFFSKLNRYDNVWTPDGLVSLKHWYAVLEVESPSNFNLKVNYHLREEHIKPQYYQKMNVALAFQFFGAADAMELLKDQLPQLQDCEGSVKFCRRVKSLIAAMNSRTPMNSLQPGNEAYKNIQSFLQFLQEWEDEAKKENKYEFITDSTCYGLKISLRGALEICNFLVYECGFNYLMMSRLNQDNLERFFGMMRHCCGSNDHPDSALFIQMYKLISTYSLIKPPKGSNVCSGEIVDVLLKIKDIKDEDDRRKQWDAQIDTILDKGLHSDALHKAAELIEEHDYFQCSTSDYVLAYTAGFVARKGKRFARLIQSDRRKTVVCENCIASLSLQENEDVTEHYKLIEMRSRGYLCKPSMTLFRLISTLERATLKIVNTCSINADTLFQITTALHDLSPVPLVGCKDHEIAFTHRIIAFYLTTRMFFITKQANKNDCIEKEKTREERKLSKLSYANNDVVMLQQNDTQAKQKTKRKSNSAVKCPVPQKKQKKTKKIN
ncbi:hypothetical protein TSAR_006395 [Trichomalopsis sarcophagae]|uniref:THAP-type domain-containing protein n=1 Tax=Trichomalopsis sarcophagae TaxID=543379 RepID=A0A232ED82_9HYME|nr:hypothetical protein TSAR_006395 [Trichomalopsis sarcophagae]